MKKKKIHSVEKLLVFIKGSIISVAFYFFNFEIFASVVENHIWHINNSLPFYCYTK